jgi:hypothetical protein
VALALVGPCMVVAPLVAVGFILSIPLWPVAVVVSACCWLLAATLEALLRAVGIHAIDGWGAATRRVFFTILTPWTYFDAPKREPPPNE